MKIYAVFDEDGFIEGFYDDEIFADIVEYHEEIVEIDGKSFPKRTEVSRSRNPLIPTNAVIVSNEDRLKIVEKPRHKKWNGVEIVDFNPEISTIQVPNEVTNYQARAALINVGLFDIADQKIRSSDNKIAVQAWDYANVFYRQSPIIQWMGQELNMTEDDIDVLFIAASKIL